MYMQIHVERERVHCLLQKSISKNDLFIYGFLQMLFGIFVRSVMDGLEPSQTHDEVNYLLLT